MDNGFHPPSAAVAKSARDQHCQRRSVGMEVVERAAMNFDPKSSPFGWARGMFARVLLAAVSLLAAFYAATILQSLMLN